MMGGFIARDASVAEFSRYPTSMISDAADERGLDCVIFRLALQLLEPVRVAGRALPVRFTPKAKDPGAYRFGGTVGRPLEQVLETMTGGDVIVMDLGGTTTASPWGGLASRLAQRTGVAGTVVWGCCRDLDEIRETGYPVWAVGTCPRRSRNEFTFGSIGEPLQIGSVVVSRGDIVVGDTSGVVVVPSDRENEVLEVVRQIAHSESAVLDQITAGGRVDWDSV